MNGVELMINDITLTCGICGFKVTLDREGIVIMEAHIKEQHPCKPKEDDHDG